jgi:hypothetical protein
MPLDRSFQHKNTINSPDAWQLSELVLSNLKGDFMMTKLPLQHLPPITQFPIMTGKDSSTGRVPRPFRNVQSRIKDILRGDTSLESTRQTGDISKKNHWDYQSLQRQQLLFGDPHTECRL